MYPYSVNLSLLPDELRRTFVASSLDADAELFIKDCLEHPHSYGQFFLETMLSLVMPAYEVHGLLRLYPMHLLSEEQWVSLLGPDKKDGTLLDVGAGQGFVTAKARGLFRKIYATETSHTMVKTLRKHGFECFETDLSREELPAKEHFDVISILNVLDRCDHPLSLLRKSMSLLKPGGQLLIATPLPLQAYIRKTIYDARPAEPLPQSGSSVFEECLSHFHDAVIRKNGLEVVRWTRLPYLWKTGRPERITALDDVVLACKQAA